MQKWIILIVVFIIIILSIFIISNVSFETEYTPESEIEEVELRKTIVTLYFKDKTSGELAKETRLIDSKDLLKNPYNELLDLLISGPENSNYEKIIPDGVSVIDNKFENGCVTINFSKELSELNLDEASKTNITNSILNTLTQLTEVNSIKILIDGQEMGINFENVKNTGNESNVNNNVNITNASTNIENMTLNEITE